MTEKKHANPAPLGLMGFGMTTILLNIHNMGFAPVNSAIIAMGIFYGGLAQVVAGIMEFRKGNSFGATAFTSYGFFWMSLCAIWMLPEMGFTKAIAPDPSFFAWYLFLWGTFTFFMWLGTWGGGRVTQFVFLSLTILFYLLAAHNWLHATCAGATVGVIAGITGVICGSSAVYLSMAELLDEVRGKKILPY
jgi:succinate-acetate transporter protein